MNWDPLSEGWEKVYDAPGVGCVYHVRTEPVEVVEGGDGPDIDYTNDEGEVDEVEVPPEVWLIRWQGREKFTKSGLAYAREPLTSATKNQIDLFS